MASYLDNLASRSDISRVTPFVPDWGFLDSAQKTLTQMQSSAFDSFAQQHSTYLKSSLSRQDNMKYRDDFMKDADGYIKQVAGTDLTDPRNLKAANSIFNTLVDNPYYVKDIVYTKNVSKGLEQSQMLRNASDPGVRSQYNPYSERELQYALADFQNASADEALGMQAPSYVKGVDFRTLSKRILDDYEISSSIDELSGDIIYTYKNGQIVEPYMRSFLQAEMSKDPAVGDYLRTYSNVSYRDQVESLVATGMDRAQASTIVTENTLLQYQMANPLEESYDVISNYMTNEDVIKRHEQNMKSGIYSYDENSAEYKDYQRAIQKRDKLAAAEKDAKETINNYGPEVSAQDKERFAKSLLSKSLLDQELAIQAKAFSLKDSGIKITVSNSAKAAGKVASGAGTDGDFQPPSYVEDALGGDVKETLNFNVQDSLELKKRGSEVQRVRKDALKAALLIDSPELKSLLSGVNIESLNSKQALDLFNKVDDAIEASDKAKIHPAYDDYLASKDLLTIGLNEYKKLSDLRKNNNKVIVSELSKKDELAKYLIDKDGNVRTKEEFYAAARIKEADTQDVFRGKSFLESANDREIAFGSGVAVLGDKKQGSGKSSSFGAYEKTLKRFTEEYNSTITRSNSPITSVYTKSTGMKEGTSVNRTTYTYDQENPNPQAMRLVENMYENIANGPADVGYGDATGEEFKNDDYVKNILKTIRPRLFTSFDSEAQGRVQYQIAYQSAAFNQLGKSAYVLKFSDPSLIKEFMPLDATDEEKAIWSKIISGGITVVMDDKNMVNKLPTYERPSLTGLALDNNNGVLEEEFKGYGTFTAVENNNGTVSISLKTSQGDFVQVIPLSQLDSIYLQIRKEYHSFLRGNNK